MLSKYLFEELLNECSMGVMDNHNGFHGFYFVSVFFLVNKKTWTSNVQRNTLRMRQEWLTIKKVEYII